MAGTLDRIRPRKNDRVFLAGATGSGKSTLAKALLWRTRHLIVTDPKRTFRLPDAFFLDPDGKPLPAVTTSDRRLVEKWEGPQPLIYRPTLEELQRPERLDWLFAWVMERGNTRVYNDEVADISGGTDPTDGLSRIIRLGRERGVGTWNATQRPARIPLICLTEAEHFFVFVLRNPDDRKRIGAYTVPLMAEPIPAKWPNGFRYYDGTTGRAAFYKRADVGEVLS